jgi:Ca2+-binding EF-hand superfamily protein
MGQASSAPPWPNRELLQAELVNLSKGAIESLWTSYNLLGDAYALTFADVVTILENADPVALGDVDCAVSMDGRAELLFHVFDTDRNGLVDALELFVTVGLLSGMDSVEKLFFVFSVYDFDSRSSLSLEETALLLRSCVNGEYLFIHFIRCTWFSTNGHFCVHHSSQFIAPAKALDEAISYRLQSDLKRLCSGSSVIS